MADFTIVVLLIAVFMATLGEAYPGARALYMDEVGDDPRPRALYMDEVGDDPRPRGQPGPGPDKQLMKSMIKDVESAWAHHDAKAIASKFAKDGVFVHKDLGMRKGRDAIMSGVKQLFRKSPKLKIRPIAYGFGKGIAIFVLNKAYYDRNDRQVDKSTDMEIMKQAKSGEWEIAETMEFQTNLVPFPRLNPFSGSG